MCHSVRDTGVSTTAASEVLGYSGACDSHFLRQCKHIWCASKPVSTSQLTMSTCAGAGAAAHWRQGAGWAR